MTSKEVSWPWLRNGGEGPVFQSEKIGDFRLAKIFESSKRK
jgi:hypothetical protein